MLRKIRQQLEQTFSKELLDKLLDEYQLVTENYYLGKHRPCSLNAGRFAEIALRMLQEVTSGVYIPLGEQITKFSNEVLALEKADSNKFPQSLRLQIPRTLQVMYDIRNKRDVGHVGGDVNANYTDATLSLTCCNWVMTELIRIYFTTDIGTAQKMVDSIIKVRIPIVQDFNGFLKILNPKLSVPDKIMALLYYRDKDGATINELNHWFKEQTSLNYIKIALGRLENERAHIHIDEISEDWLENVCVITDTGKKYVEENIALSL
jgi:hypothetical protein